MTPMSIGHWMTVQYGNYETAATSYAEYNTPTHHGPNDLAAYQYCRTRGTRRSTARWGTGENSKFQHPCYPIRPTEMRRKGLVFGVGLRMPTMQSSLLLVSIFLQLSIASLANYAFAVIPKSLDNPFYNATHDGCLDAARVLGVICLWTAPEHEDPELQANVTLHLIRNRLVDGIAVSVDSIEIMVPVIAESVKAGIPVITFDSDAPDSARSVYVGTDNSFFGSELGKVLDDLQPEGGSYAIVAGTAPNLQARANALLTYLDGIGKWKQLLNSPSDSEGDPLLAVAQISAFAKEYPTAIISVMGAPMRSGKWEAFVNDNDPTRNITLVCGDAMPNQLAFLDRGKNKASVNLFMPASTDKLWLCVKDMSMV